MTRDLNYRRGRSGRPFNRLKARVYTTETVCCICGREVDLDLPYRDDHGNINVWSKSIEHPVELDRGGNPYDGHLAHLRCNMQKGADYRNNKGQPQQPNTHLTASPDWE